MKRHCLIAACGLIAALLIVAPLALGTSEPETIEVSYSFDEPELMLDGPYGVPTMPGALIMQRVGQPMLPMVPARILLPEGSVPTKIEVIAGPAVTLPQPFQPRLATEQLPTNVAAAAPQQGTFLWSGEFPGKLYEQHSIQHLRGARILLLNLFPVQYDADSGLLLYYPQLDVRVELADQDADLGQRNFRGKQSDLELISGFVDNPELLQSYPERIDEPAATYDYLIIANSSLVSSVASYKTWIEDTYGISAYVKNLSEIYSSYSGVDNAAEIREFIQDAYDDWDVEYVLLVGDTDPNGTQLLPHRGVKVNVSSTYEYDMPCDLYFAALDGPWNNDGDSYWGESNDGAGGGDVDLYADVYVGRISADSSTEVANQLNKTIAHVHSGYTKKALLVGEQLDSYTYGGDNKDHVWGYVSGLTSSTLYERDGTFSASAVSDAINSNNYDFVNHLGHANPSYVMGLDSDDIVALSNTDPVLAYSQGCYSASFDNRWSSGSYGSADSVGEYFVVKTDNGAWAYIGNSRYGWYLPGSEYGVSNIFDVQFMDALFGENKRQVGDALYDSKNDLASSVSSSGAERWVYFDLNLLGCPYIPVMCGGCEISGACYPPGTTNGDCYICDPGSSATSWSYNNGATCDDGEFCTVNDACSSGACSGSARDCDDGEFCTGTESCDEDANACVSAGDPCDETEICVEESDECSPLGDDDDDDDLDDDDDDDDDLDDDDMGDDDMGDDDDDDDTSFCGFV
ncbi:MAG: C25 family cysteine peptidase [Candidatus Alcyoniella australis]|nr:C25 family cysteine peptidase [Candidatus Alcyoniella australis]